MGEIGAERFASRLPAAESAVQHHFGWGSDAGNRSPLTLRAPRDGKTLAKLKVLAGLLGVSLDTLNKRERRRRRQQFSTAALAFALLAGTALLGLARFYSDRRANEARCPHRPLATFF